MFAGALAQTADARQLVRARQMAEAGEGPRQIHAVTGWFRGGDGRWRFEISDDGATLLPAMRTLWRGGYAAAQIVGVDWRQREDGLYDLTLSPPSPQKTTDFVGLHGLPWVVVEDLLPKALCQEILAGRGEPAYINNFEDAQSLRCDFQFEGMNMLPLRLVLDHPGLYAAYPALMELPIQVVPELGANAAFVTFTDGREAIRMGSGHQLTSLVHELQHAVQSLEGFSVGGGGKCLQEVREAMCALKVRQEMQWERLLGQRAVLAERAYGLLDVRSREALLARADLAAVRSELYEQDDDFFRDVALNLDEYGAWLIDAAIGPHISALSEVNSQLRLTRRDKERTAALLVEFEQHGIPGIYQRLHGEIEARLAADRISMSAQERAVAWPLDMADTPPEAALFLEEMTGPDSEGSSEAVRRERLR